MEIQKVLSFDGLRMNPNTREILVRGEPATLTAREFDLLHHLASSPGRVYTRDQLMELVWGYLLGGYQHRHRARAAAAREVEPNPASPAICRPSGASATSSADEKGAPDRGRRTVPRRLAGAGHLRPASLFGVPSAFASRGGSTRRGREEVVCWRCSSSAPPCSGVSAACRAQLVGPAWSVASCFSG